MPSHQDRVKKNYICAMCGKDQLVGKHVRTVKEDGTVIEDCPTRVFLGLPPHNNPDFAKPTL